MEIIRFAWKKWKAIAHKIGVFQSKVILTLFYFTFILPLGFIFSLTRDELKIKRPQNTWNKKLQQSQTLIELGEQA